MYTMELPSQSGLVSPGMDPGTDSDSDQGHARVHSNRKSNKPLLEKKRRARINKSLDQLKGLVLEALKKDSARYSKLEKADILEMTVKHLREVQRHQMTVAMSLDPTVVGKFRTGFGECAQEVDRYLSTIDGLSAEVRLRLMQHLSRCSGQLQHVATSFPGMGGPAASQHPAAPGISVFPGIPSASPPQALPGMGIRCSLPFGGLALSSPESPPSLSHAYTPSPEPRSTPKAHHQQHQHGAHPPKSEFPPGFSSSKRDDAENVAPGRSQRPLAEKRFNTNLRVGDEFGDRNNNSAHGKDYLPPTKRQKREASYFHGNGYHNDIRRDAHNLLAMDIKMEPVWRPW